MVCHTEAEFEELERQLQEARNAARAVLNLWTQRSVLTPLLRQIEALLLPVVEGEAAPDAGEGR